MSELTAGKYGFLLCILDLEVLQGSLLADLAWIKKHNNFESICNKFGKANVSYANIDNENSYPYECIIVFYLLV